MSCKQGCHNRLYRDPKNGKIAGVCAGIADYFSLDVTLVRILAIVSGLTFTVVTVIFYILADIYLPVKPDNLYDDDQEESYWRKYRKSPRDTLADTRYRFRKLERRLNKMEAYVTSDKYQLERELQDLDRKPAR